MDKPVRVIPLSRGLVAIVDEDDYASLAAHRWYAQRTGRTFAACRNVGGRANRRMLWMHRVVLGAPDGALVDHVNGDPLDNRRANLRLTDHVGNARNVHYGTSRYSPFKGVRRVKNSPRGWAAEIKVAYRSIHLGMFDSPEEAARAYDRAALEHFGEYAWLNYPVAGSVES